MVFDYMLACGNDSECVLVEPCCPCFLTGRDFALNVNYSSWWGRYLGCPLSFECGVKTCLTCGWECSRHVARCVDGMCVRGLKGDLD